MGWGIPTSGSKRGDSRSLSMQHQVWFTLQCFTVHATLSVNSISGGNRLWRKKKKKIQTKWSCAGRCVSGLQPSDYTSQPVPRPPQEQSTPRLAESHARQAPIALRGVARCRVRAGSGGWCGRARPGAPPAALRSPQAAPPRGTWGRGAELLARPGTASATVFCMNGAEKMNSAMSEEPDALSVVNQLRDLAADPLNRRAIVQDQGCLPGLILFLDHPNPPVVHSALLALRYLAECRVNREKMKSELGMMLSLQNVIQKTTTPGETKLLASEVYDVLQSSNMSDMDSVNEMNYRRRKAQFFLGSTNKRAKTVVLHIDGLDDSSRRNLCEEALLKIKGVISFTFQMAVQRCVVRIRSDLKAEALATAIASTKVMKAQQVVKSESGEEMLVPFQDTPVEVEQNTDLPEYLPEDESPTKEQDKAVSRVGSHPEGAASWLSTAANFLSRSFYW